MAESNSGARPAAYWFMHSVVFQGGRDLSGGSGEGETGENPIFLPDTTHDFRSLVKLLQDFDTTAPTPEAGHRLTKGEWFGALRLAQKYQMDEIKEKVIQVLSSPGLLIPVKRIQLACEYHLVQWLIQGVEELLSADITTDKPICLDGLDAETAEKVVIKKCHLRPTISSTVR
ncbi:hypothetical protein FA13DRAFT_1794704 [Coprinellus micaceus]|uniref:BTB domain-containing protein n=1 Tax=Coprinellus micaceus TaxID=71717 RepID=A0A4Y7T0S8_COPMI|nr:hypothetical protein FA13DRAFT_1794704 [Coprinellus micaceus]